jgi:hypothetical protein
MSAVASPAIVLGSSESFVDSVVKVAGAFKKMSSDKIMKKIQGLEETLEALRQQLVQSRSEDFKPATKKEKVQKQKQEKEAKGSDGATVVGVAEEKEKEKEKVPMPWTGSVDFATCVGLKAQYGLFLQCGKTCDPKSRVFQIDNHDCRFCGDCVKKCDEQGNHPVGTMEQRIEAGVGKYVNAKTGKKETLYIDALEKMGITKEEALEAAGKRGFQIPDWMLEKAEKKRGRPSSKNVTTGDGVVSENASSENGSEAEKKPKQQIKKMKKTASAITTDTPQKMIPECAAESESLVDAAADAADAHEKKKRGRPAKTITKKNVAESEMQQLIVQATAEKKKRLSFGPDIYTPLATTTTTTVVEPAFHGDSASEQTGIAVNINFDEITDEDGFINFDNFGDQEDNIDNNQDQKEEQEQEQVDVVAVAAVDALPSLAGKVGGGNHPSHPDCAESALDVAVEKKKDKSEKKESKKKDSEKKESKKKDSEKKESKKKDKSEKKEKKESEKKKEPEPEKKKEEVVVDEEEEEELECDEYEYEGETYGLAPNGDIYSQDGDLVGKVTNGVTKMFN